MLTAPSAAIYLLLPSLHIYCCVVLLVLLLLLLLNHIEVRFTQAFHFLRLIMLVYV